MLRNIRTRCGFGCVICGIPLYEYDHMNGWANTKEHREEDITLLCDSHHKQVTNKLLSRNAVRNANSNPYNLQKGISKPYFLNYAGGNLVTVLGGNIFQTQVPLIIEDQPIIGYKSDGETLLLYVRLFNEKGELILAIRENELVYSMDPWDIEFQTNQLTLRAGRGKFLIRMRFVVPNKLVIDRGTLRFKEHSVSIHDNEMRVDENNIRMTDCQFVCSVGIIIGKYTGTSGCAIRID